MNTKYLEKNLERITDDTRRWTPNLDIVPPIDSSDIPNFKEWVNWSGWKGYEEEHTALDFACYLDTKGDVILGLPHQTPVRAIADGRIHQISNLLGGDDYQRMINIEHSANGNGLFSGYHHVLPSVENGLEVKKGQIIGTLFRDLGEEEGRLVHLHHELRNGWRYGSARDRTVNPETLYTMFLRYRAEPQGSPNFNILGLKEQPKRHIANFKRLLVGND